LSFPAERTPRIEVPLGHGQLRRSATDRLHAAIPGLTVQRYGQAHPAILLGQRYLCHGVCRTIVCRLRRSLSPLLLLFPQTHFVFLLGFLLQKTRPRGFAAKPVLYGPVKYCATKFCSTLYMSAPAGFSSPSGRQAINFS
jgi:hypothetical protein